MKEKNSLSSSFSVGDGIILIIHFHRRLLQESSSYTSSSTSFTSSTIEKKGSERDFFSVSHCITQSNSNCYGSFFHHMDEIERQLRQFVPRVSIGRKNKEVVVELSFNL